MASPWWQLTRQPPPEAQALLALAELRCDWVTSQWHHGAKTRKEHWRVYDPGHIDAVHVEVDASVELWAMKIDLLLDALEARKPHD